MVQMTNEALENKIKEAIRYSDSIDGERVNLSKVKTKNHSVLAPVIEFEVELLKLNPKSHRIKSQLDGDPRWEDLKNDPFSNEAQGLVAHYVKIARTSEEFVALKADLDRGGQREYALITKSGVLVNGNTRAVALREFEDPKKRVIRVAVIEEDIGELEIALIETRLQVQKDMKVEYTLTNKLLIIENHSNSGMTDEAIANELNLHADNKKGAKLVNTQRRMLDLLRDVCRIPSEELKLCIFDRPESIVSHESLKDLLEKQDELAEQNPDKWQRYVATWLLCILSGHTAVHELRQILLPKERLVSDFFEDYLLPSIESDELLSPHFEGLPSRRLENDDDLVVSPTLLGLVDSLASKDKKIKISNSAYSIDINLFRSGLKRSIDVAALNKKTDGAVAKQADKPTELVKDALVKLERCEQYLNSNSDLDEKTRARLVIAFKKVKKKVKNIEEILNFSN